MQHHFHILFLIIPRYHLPKCTNHLSMTAIYDMFILLIWNYLPVIFMYTHLYKCLNLESLSISFPERIISKRLNYYQRLNKYCKQIHQVWRSICLLMTMHICYVYRWLEDNFDTINKNLLFDITLGLCPYSWEILEINNLLIQQTKQSTWEKLINHHDQCL